MRILKLTSFAVMMSCSLAAWGDPTSRPAAGPATQPAPVVKTKPAKGSPQAQIVCTSHMRQCCLGAQLYANAHKGAVFPPDIASLYVENDGLVDDESYACPDAAPKMPANWATMDVKARGAWWQKNTTYVYEGKGLNADMDADIILFSEQPGTHKGGMNIGLVDGSVSFVPAADLAKVRAKSDAARKAAQK